MSDHYLYFVPTDPRCVPERQAIERALALLERRAPEADEVTTEQSAGIRLYDAGRNFESVHCPTCRHEIELDWWHDALDRDSDGDGDGVHVRLLAYPVPCCGAEHSLDQLTYDWPQAFGRFALVAMNAGLGRVTDQLKADIEQALGTGVSIVYHHI